MSLLLFQTTSAAHVAAASTSVVSTSADSISGDNVDSADVIVNATVASEFGIELDTVPYTVVMLSVDGHVKGDSKPTHPVSTTLLSPQV